MEEIRGLALESVEKQRGGVVTPGRRRRVASTPRQRFELFRQLRVCFFVLSYAPNDARPTQRGYFPLPVFFLS